MCHELIDEAMVGHGRAHALWTLEYYYSRLKKHPRDNDLRTKIKILEYALNKSPECAIDFREDLLYNEPKI